MAGGGARDVPLTLWGERAVGVRWSSEEKNTGKRKRQKAEAWRRPIFKEGKRREASEGS